ncbi:hypothetical protein MC885_009169, partial [Smutsia gigantea]
MAPKTTEYTVDGKSPRGLHSPAPSPSPQGRTRIAPAGLQALSSVVAAAAVRPTETFSAHSTATLTPRPAVTSREGCEQEERAVPSNWQRPPALVKWASYHPGPAAIFVSGPLPPVLTQGLENCCTSGLGIVPHRYHLVDTWPTAVDSADAVKTHVGHRAARVCAHPVWAAGVHARLSMLLTSRRHLHAGQLGLSRPADYRAGGGPILSVGLRRVLNWLEPGTAS